MCLFLREYPCALVPSKKPPRALSWPQQLNQISHFHLGFDIKGNKSSRTKLSALFAVASGSMRTEPALKF